MIWVILAWATLVAAAGAPLAATIDPGDEIVTRADRLRGRLVLPEPLDGKAKLKLTWTDSYGRTVALEESDVQADAGIVPFEIDLAPAVALQNFIEAELSLGGRVFAAPKAEFIVTPEYDRWDDYQIIMYYPYERSLQRALRKVGITAGKISGTYTRRPDGAAAWYPFDYRFYCDQISTFFYAAYHTPAHQPKNKMYQLAKEQYRADRTAKKPFYREPCFHDEAALADALERLRTAVRTQKRFKPWFYAHCDEAGVADLVAPWDFCFDPRTLAAMRKWLLDEYGSLEGINREWGTDFKSMGDVTPLTTDEMMARGDDNLSPWADHRHFMNRAFADVLSAGTRAVREEDPKAYIGLVGCQMPAAFGGYDYWLLSQVMECIEPYNIGNNREIWRSLVPEKPAVTTAFGFGDWEVWRLWFQMLHGDLGIIIYDEEFRYLDENGEPTELGASIAPTYRELAGGLRKQLAYMERVEEPIGIHYSHPSVTAHWMLEVRPRGKDWIERESWHDRQDSEFYRLRESWTKVIEDNLRQYDFIAYGQLENGDFDDMNCRVMILPQSIAMSEAECDALRRFVERGGVLVADCRTALMDEHCRMLDGGRLDDVFGIRRTNLEFAPGPAGLAPVERHGIGWVGKGDLDMMSAAEPGVAALEGAVACYEDSAGTPAVIVNRYGNGTAVYLNAVVTDYHRWRLKPPEHEGLAKLMESLLCAAGVERRWDLTTGDGAPPHGIEVHPWRRGDMWILALHRNYQLRVSELGPPEYQSQAALEADMPLVLSFDAPKAVYDQRRGVFLGKSQRFELDLPRYEPVILTVLGEPVGALGIDAPEAAAPGDLLDVRLGLAGTAADRTHAFRVKVFGPDGAEMEMHTETIAAAGGRARWRVPIAVSDPEGDYTLKVRDVATGAAAEKVVKVERP